MKKIIKLTIIIFILIPLKFAYADSGLLISPAVNDLILKPGEAYAGTFNIRNNHEYNISLELQKGSLTSKGEVSLDSSNDVSTQWISTNQTNVAINSFKDLTYNYSINIPLDAQEGFYRPMFILKLSSEQNESGAVTSLTQLLPFQLNIFVSENGKYDGFLKINKLNVGSTILIGNQQKVDFAVSNINPSPSKPLIRIQVLSPEGEIIYQSVKNESLLIINQNQEIAQSLNISDSFNDGSKIGRYTIELYVKDILTSREVTSRIAFWYLPQPYVNAVVVILFVLVLVALLTLKIKRNIIKNRKEDKHLFMYK
ncbi:MAG: hypothetical protein ACMG57_01065 [Candidatus Dojkabacteria bacterium]